MTETPTEAIPEPQDFERKSPRVRKLTLPVLLGAGVAIWFLMTGESQSVQQQSMIGGPGKPVDATAVSSQKLKNSHDEDFRKLIVGKWETQRPSGKRVLSVRDDGTAVMNVEITDLSSLVFGNKLRFDIEWTIDNSVLTFSTTGGHPQDKVDLLTKMYGKDRVQQIKLLDETTLRLPDDDPDSEDHVWTRVE